MSLSEETLPHYLRSIGLIGSDEQVRVEEAGDGNINWVRRVRTNDGRSWIVKRAGPTLERFPEYQADPIRLVFEASYMDIARPCDDDCVLPEVLHLDPDRYVMVLEDLGQVPRLGEVAIDTASTAASLVTLARFLARVHAATAGRDLEARFANEQMRRLHGDHIFVLPFRPNDFPLSAALRQRAEEIWADTSLRTLADDAYRRYLDSRAGLVHADVQASNILLTESGPKLLDAEIAHVGDPAFDIGTLSAHVLLPGIATNRLGKARDTVRTIWRAYRREANVAFADVARYAGIEMLRRTIGAARVAAVDDDATALCVLDRACELIRDPPTAI